MIVFRIVRRKVRNWIKTGGMSGTQGGGLPGRRANGSRQRPGTQQRGQCRGPLEVGAAGGAAG